MLVLALDTSGPMVTVGLVDVSGDGAPGAARADRSRLAPNRQGELLAELVHGALADAAVPGREVAAIAVGLGPGPFTGLRAGVVTAAALADAWSVPAYGCCSLDAVPRPTAAGGVLVVSDARRRQLYWARYDAAGHRVEGPELAPPAELAARLGGAVERVVGPAVDLARDAFAGTGARVADEPAHPGVTGLAGLVAADVVAGAAAGPLTPLYLRRPDARPPGRPKRVTPA